MTGVVGHEGSRGDELVVGVDTHQDEHVAVVIDRQGVRLGEFHTVATIKGYVAREVFAVLRNSAPSQSTP